MTIRNFWIFLISSSCLIILNSCHKSIDPEEPSLSASDDIPKIVQPYSKIDMSVTMELGDNFKKIDTSISNEKNDSTHNCRGFRYVYKVTRSPFTIEGSGNTINLSFQGNYQIKVSYCTLCKNDKCIVPKIGGGCGMDEPMRKINIAYSSAFNVLNNYRIHSSTSLVTLQPENKCKITKFDIDATDKLVDQIRTPLENLGKKLDTAIAKVDLKPKVQDLWNRLSREIPLGNLGYLSIRPQTLSMDSFLITGSSLKTKIGIDIKPVISTTSKPQPIIPLPDLTDYSPGNGFEIYFDIAADYDSLSNILTKKIKGKKIQVKKGEIILTDSKIYGVGNKKIIIAVYFEGKRNGKIYFLGTPHFNSETNMLTFSDLEFDSKTKDLLVEMEEWLFYKEVKDIIKSKAEFNFSKLINKGKDKFHQQINRRLGKNAYLTGNVSSVKIQAIYPAKSKFLFRARSRGSMEIQIR